MFYNIAPLPDRCSKFTSIPSCSLPQTWFIPLRRDSHLTKLLPHSCTLCTRPDKNPRLLASSCRIVWSGKHCKRGFPNNWHFHNPSTSVIRRVQRVARNAWPWLRNYRVVSASHNFVIGWHRLPSTCRRKHLRRDNSHSQRVGPNWLQCTYKPISESHPPERINLAGILN